VAHFWSRLKLKKIYKRENNNTMTVDVTDLYVRAEVERLITPTYAHPS